MKSNRYAPFIAMTVALFCLSVMDALIKYVSSEHQTWQIVVLRYGMGFIISALLFSWHIFSKPGAFAASNLLTRTVLTASMVRSVFVLITATSFFYAVSQLPLAQVITITFTAPLFIVGFSYVLLKEPVSRVALMAILLGFCGVLIIFQDTLSAPETTAILPLVAAISASVFYALSIVLARKHSAHSSPLEMVLLQTLFALILALPFGLFSHPVTSWVTPSPGFWLLFIAIGFLGTCGHLLIIWALRRETASKLGTLEYTTLIWAILFGFILFNDWPTLHTLLGATLVICGCIVVTRGEKGSNSTG